MESKRSGGLLWSAPVTVCVLAVSATLLGAAVIFAWVIPETKNGSHEGVTIGLAMIGVIGFLIGLVSRVDTILYIKYRDIPLPEIRSGLTPTTPGPVDMGRVTIRRFSGNAHWFLMGTAGFIATCMLWLELLHKPSPPNLLVPVAFGTIFAVGLLVGPAARFIVTNEYLFVDTGFRREQISRGIIESMESGRTDLKIRLSGGRSFRFRVDSPLADVRRGVARENYRAQVRTARRLASAFAEVPFSPTGDEATALSWRAGPIVATALIVIVDVAVLVVM